MSAFSYSPSSLHKSRSRGYQSAPLSIIFNVKAGLGRKVRIVIVRQVSDFSKHEVYVFTMNSVSDRIIFTIAEFK